MSLLSFSIFHKEKLFVVKTIAVHLSEQLRFVKMKNEWFSRKAVFNCNKAFYNCFKRG